MRSWQDIAFTGQGVQKGPRKVQEPVDIRKVRHQTQGNPHRPATLHPHLGEQLIPAPYLSEKLLPTVPLCMLVDPLERRLRLPERRFGRPGVTQAACAQREHVLVGSLFHYPLIHDAPVGSEEIERDGRSTPLRPVRAIDLHQRRPVAMAQRQQQLEYPAGQAHDTLVNSLHADAHEVSEPDLHCREGEVVDGAILEGDLAFGEHVAITMYAGAPDRAPAKPGAAQSGQGSFARQQAADTRGVAEQLIERDRHKIGLPPG